VLQCAAVRLTLNSMICITCSILYPACCGVLQRVAVCCSVLQRVAACCSVLL